MRLFDCHSHWATDKGYIFRTKAERAQQEKVWRTPFKLFTEDEQAEYFRSGNARVILDISWINEVILQCTVYLGMPKALFAMRKLKAVMAEKVAATGGRA